MYKATLTEDAQDTFFYHDERRVNQSLTELVASGELQPGDLQRASRLKEPSLGSGKMKHKDRKREAGTLIIYCKLKCITAAFDARSSYRRHIFLLCGLWCPFLPKAPQETAYMGQDLKRVNSTLLSTYEVRTPSLRPAYHP